jgi:hypothetical protein
MKDGSGRGKGMNIRRVDEGELPIRNTTYIYVNS